MGVKIVEESVERVVATMPVEGNRQSFGLLHGGASLALAETLGSAAGNMCVDRRQKACVGLEINANHVRAVRSGFVTGRASPVHLGNSTQVWDIRIHDEQERLVCVARITMAVLDLPDTTRFKAE
jgi:1,4-dihydroxy-2-naphthoyl-CoA hydrolase